MEIVLKKSEAVEPFTFAFISEGVTIVKSENYKAKAGAVNGIESVRKNSQVDARYEMKESKNGKFFFNIKSTNGQIVGTSKLFASDEDRNSAIDLLKAEAPEAEVSGV